MLKCKELQTASGPPLQGCLCFNNSKVISPWIFLAKLAREVLGGEGVPSLQWGAGIPSTNPYEHLLCAQPALCQELVLAEGGALHLVGGTLGAHEHGWA